MKLASVVVKGKGDSVQVIGYGRRDKNRKVLWIVDGKGKTDAEILSEVQQKESTRLAALDPLQGIG